MKPSLLLLLFGSILHADNEILDGIAAVVGDDVVTFSQLRARVAPYERELRETLKGEALIDAIKRVRQSQLERLIERQLLLQELKRRGSAQPADATDEEIDTAIKERFQSDREQWLKRLRAGAAIKRF